MLNYFDGILYINLVTRPDRKQEIEAELKKHHLDPSKTFRIEGELDELNGTRGCVLSHIRALDFALEKKWKNVLILEDDCLFTEDKAKINAYISDFLAHFQDSWDVFFLGTSVHKFKKSPHPDYIQVLFSLRAHAYVVNGPYMKKLRDHFLETHASMERDLFFLYSMDKALDRQWATLQSQDRWYVGQRLIAEQRESYSDIEKVVKRQR